LPVRCLADPGDRVVAERYAGVDAADLGADVAGERGHVDVRGRGRVSGMTEHLSARKSR
jgi:hypothetical protein